MKSKLVPFQIQTNYTTKQVRGQIVGEILGVYYDRSDRGYSVTHIPTGLRMNHHPLSKGQALMLAEMYIHVVPNLKEMTAKQEGNEAGLLRRTYRAFLALTEADSNGD